jgi:hypothetical protein
MEAKVRDRDVECGTHRDNCRACVVFGHDEFVEALKPREVG